MGFFNWLNRYLGKTEATPNLEFDSFREDSNAKLELVRLEDRIVLSVSAGVTGDVLELNLDAANDEATVSVVDSGATIQVDDGLGLPDSILQFDATQLSSILVTGTDSSQVINLLGQEDLNLSGTFDTTNFTGDVNIGIELLVGPGESPQFNPASTVTYLGRFELTGDQLDVILPNVLNADDAFVIQINGSNLEILNQNLTNPLLFSTPAGSLSSINVFGADGETDFLTLDYSSAGLSDISVTFDGGTGGNDALEFSNGVFDTVTHNLTGPGAGSVDFNGNGITEITYVGLEPVFGGTSTANNIVINLPTATLDAVLEDSTVSGEMQIRSLSAAFELTTFASPTDSLTINTSGGNSVVTLNSFDTTFAPNDLIISGQSGDIYQLTGNDLLADTVSLTLSGGATLNLGAFNETVNGFVLEEGTVIATSGILSTQSDLDLRSGTVQAQLNGTNLIKNGTGTVILSGTNSFTGSSTIQDGLLKVEGSLTASEVIVSTGAVLGGSGTVDAPVTVNTGGVLAPGSSPGIIGTNNLALSAGSTLDIEIDGTTAGTDYDQIQVTGTVDVTGATLNLISVFTAAAGNEFLLIENDGADSVTGTFAGLAEGTLLTFNGNQVYITYQGGDGNDVALTVNTHPVVDNQLFDVDENTSNTTSLGTIVSTDPDVPADSLTFSVTGGTGQTAFNVSASGEITVADQSQLDFEFTASLDLEILVTDSAGATDTATITIDLNPLNDNAPVVNNQIRSVDENTINGTNVGAVIVATDDDLPGDTLTFSETGGTGAAAFDITAGGQIVVVDQSLLNFETNPSYTLDILVDDNAGSTTTASVTINLNDLVEVLFVNSTDWSANDITLVRDGSQLRVLETGTLNEIVPSHNFANVSSVIITGNGLDNTVQLDSSGGIITPLGGINFEGGAGSDTLVAANQANIWNINGVNSGNLQSGSVVFTSVENLTGNDNTDTFVMQVAGQIDGIVNGRAGLDHLNLSNETTDLSVTLTSLGITDGFDGNELATSVTFENIDQLTGGTGTNSLTGINSAANWTLNGTNTYQSINTFGFSNFVNLTGGSDSDIFNVTPDTQAFNIVGGDPSSNPLGDQLNIDTSTAGTALVTSNGNSAGSVSGTFPTITYSEIENFAITGVVDIQIDGTTSNDTIEILVMGPNIEYRLGGTLIGISSLTQTNSITVNAGDGDDSLTVDSALAAEGITVDYDGEGQNSTNPGDILNLLGTTTSVEYFFADITSGSIRINGALTDFITYTGLEPITSTINAADITLNYSGVSETITISDAGGGQTTVTSTAGEMLTFSDPTNSLTINTGAGDDVIDINSLTANFTASLTINGDNDLDTLNANASISLDTGNHIEFNVETINIANGITVTAAGIALNATTVELDGDLVSTNVSGDATTVNVLGSAGGADLQDAVDVAGNGGTINIATGVYITANTLDIDESVSLLGAGSDVVEIRKAGDPTNNFDVAVNITADNVTISGAQLGWETHTSATDYQGYVVLTTADNTTLNSLLFGDNYRSAVVFAGADNLEVSDSIFEGKFGRAAIRDGSGGSGENFLITRNEFRADHFRWGPIAIGPQGTFGDPNNFAFSGVISFNYFGNGLEAGSFQEAGDQNYTVTITNGGMTADGIDIIHNSFDWQDSATTNANGIFAQPGGIFFDPSLSVPIGTVNITDNIFNGFTYDGPQPTTDPLWNPTGGVFGGALEFDGVDDFGLFQDSNFDVGESGTLSFWVNMDDQGRRNQFFEGLNSAGFEFQFRTNSGGQFFGSPGRAGNLNNIVIQDGNAGGTENVWQNLQYTWDFNAVGNPQMHIYIDGVEVAYLNTTFDSDLTQWVATVNTVNELITVGRDASGDRYFDGLMDDVGWFNEALDQTDRDNIRNNGVATLAADARLVAHWDFDQASGDIALDNKNGIQMLIATNGIVPFGPEFQTAAGQFGGALQFDGIDDFATFQDTNFDIGRQGTLNFWVNMDDTGRRNQFFEGPDNGGLEFQYRSNGGGQFFGRTQDGADFTIQQGGQSGVQGVWTNIQYTWDADTGEMHIYLNGSEEPYLSSFDENLAGFDSTHFTDTINGLMNVGRDPGDAGRFFEGLMDDIGWFNDVLNQTERADIMNNSVASLAGDSRLVAHWNLDDAPGTTIVSGNSGTNIDLYIQAEPPLPPIEGFGVMAPLNANVTFNAFNDNDLDSNVFLDNTNVFGDPLFAYESDPLFVNTPSLEEQFTIGFGSSAAYTSSEFASDTNTTTPHIGAFQNPPTIYPGVFGSGDIVIFGTDEDDLLELTFTSENTATFVLTRDVGGANETLETVILTDITSITFNGLGGDDVMILNQPDNQFANPSGGILFNGGSQNNNGNALGVIGLDGDTLVINHNTPIEADSVSYVFTPDAVPAEGEDGVITITDVSISDGSTTITFTGLEPVIDNLLVADRDFDFTDATETISLSDDGVAGDNYSFIDSDMSESVLFLNPTNSLTIRTDSVGTPVGVDTVQINSLDSLFDASLTILAGSDDSVTFQTTTDLVTGDLFVTAESVDILADINAASTDISSSGVTSTTFNGGTITTTGSQLYNNAVNFSTNTTLTSTGGSSIEFSSTVDGGVDLNIDTAGNTIFNAAVGSNTALNSLTTNAGGSTQINGSAITTAGSQTYHDAVTLGANTILSSNGIADIIFNSTLNGAFTLNINTAGNSTFNGTVGNTDALTSLITNSTGTTNINGGSITTTGAQAFDDAVLLGANTTLSSTTAGNITFNSTLNGAFTLAINTDANTTFNGAVGNNSALTSLTTNVNGTTNINGGSVNTTGNQTYNDAVLLGDNTILTSTGTGDITFESTLDGAFTLGINTDGNTTFNGAIGTNSALNSLTTDAIGTTNFNGGSITSTGSQTFNDAVLLGDNTILTSTGIGDITFESTLDGAFALGINTDGNTNFNGTVGNNSALTSLITDTIGTTNINGGSVITTGNQTYNDVVLLGANTVLTSSGTGDITFESTLNGAFTLDINTDGNTTFNGAVGNNSELNNLTTDAIGSTNINGGSVTTSGNQTYNDAVLLGANTILTSTVTGDITFESTLDGAFTLGINTNGNTIFNGAVGNNSVLTSLTTNAIGTTNINGGSVTTTGNQTYNDAVILGNNTVLNTTGIGDITFESTLDGMFTLDINTDGNTIFNAAVGNNIALTSLTTDVNGTTAINGGSVTTTDAQTYNDAITLDASTTFTSTTTGDITFNSSLTGGTGFSIDITSQNEVNIIGTFMIDTNVTVDAGTDILVSSLLSSATGDITLRANNDINLSSTASILSQTNGQITLTADNDGVGGGSITMASGSTVESQGGLVQFSANGMIAVSSITTTGGRVELTSTNGNIRDNDITATKNVTANQLVINSNAGIGQFADAIDTAISFLEADAGTGGLFLDNMGNMTIGNITAQVGLDADLDILVNAMGTLNISENVQSTTGSVEMNATDTLTADVATTIATFGTGALLITSTRNIKLNSGSNLRTVDGGITLLANNGGVTAGEFTGIEAENATIETTGDGNISLTGFGGTDALTSDHHGIHLHSGTSVTSTDTGASAGTITINGTGGTGIANNRGVFIEGASTNVTSVDGNIQIFADASNGNGFVLADQASIVSNGNGANAATIAINGTTSSDNAGVTINSNVQSLDGDIAITGVSNGGGIASEGVLIQTVAGQVNSTNANITINGTSNGDDGIEISDSSSITITGTGILQLQGESTGTGNGIELNTTINSNSGTVTLTSEYDIILGSVALINSTSGIVIVTADNAVGNNGNPISMADGALIDAGSGDINLTTDGNVLLGGLLTTGTVNVSSLSAAIIDNGDTHTDIVASTAVLNAITGIGDGNPLETEISTLSATVSGIGDLFIDNTIAVELLNLSTFDGQIAINATDTITATSIVSNNNSASDSNDILLTATGTNSDILVTTITAAGNADVTLTADDGILDTNGADANRITADNLIMTSSSAGGTQDGIDVDTSINSVTAAVNTNAGGIRIDEVNDIILTQVTTNDGPITVNAGGTIQVLDVNSANSSAADLTNGISLTATGATSDIIITTLTAENTADITLNAGRDILDSDSTDINITTGDQLTAVAGRNIGGIISIFTEAGFDPLQTSVDHLDLTSGNIIAIHNTGTTPELINLDAGTGTTGTTFIRATGGALDASTTTGINNIQDNIGFVSDVSITVPTGLQTSNLRLDAPDIIDAGGGNIDINAVNAILFNSASAETIEITAQQFDGTVTGSDFIITNDSPALELVDLDSNSVALTGGADTNISLTSAGTITITNLVQVLGTGTLSLETTNTDADLVLNQNIQSGTGTVTISTADDIIFNGTSNLTSTSDSVMLTADADNGAGGLFGGITMADGSFIDAGDGIVSLTATDNITIGHIITTNATDLAIHLETDASVIDAGDSTGEDLVANAVGARVTIIAALGAGKVADTNGAIETQIDQVDITNLTSGEIQLVETDAVIIHDIIQTTAGNIRVVAGGNILLSGLVQTTTGDVLLDTQAAIIDQNDGLPDPLNIHSVNLDLNAVTGIGVGDTLEISVDSFYADTTNGDILLHNTATNAVTASSISTGTGNIELEQIGNESLSIDLASTLDGNITISNEGDAQTDFLTLTSITAGGTTPEINISTIGFGNILLGDVTALDGAISVTSAGNINDAVNDQAAPEIDLNAASGSITLQAVNGIGNNQPVELAGGTLSVNTTTGNIDVSNTYSVATGPVGVSRLTTGSGTIHYLQSGGQNTTFEEISTTGSAITVETDGSILFENSGVLTNVVSTDGAGTIQVTATGLNSSIEINDGFRTTGGSINLTAQHSLTFGIEGDINSSNGNITLLADSASLGVGGGGISMSDGTIFDAGIGVVDLQAGDNIAIGQLLTTALTRLTSVAGGVVDAGDTGGRDITADELVVRTATGTGSANALETAISLLAASNTDSGSIQIHNDLGGALLTIGTVDGLAGITNSANTPGDIIVTNASPLTVDAPVTNSSGGNIGLESTGPGDLTLNASIRAFGGNGNIDVNADDGILAINDTGVASDHSVAGTGIFSGHGTSGVLIDNNTTLNSETGAIAGVPPVLMNILTPQILATGDATVTGDFGRFTEQNFFITIDWGDGTVETFNFADPGSFVFNHTYTFNPNIQNPAADIPILVTMQGDMQFTFTDGNGSLDFTSEAGLLETPGEGLANIAIDTTPQVPQLLFPQSEVILDSTSNQQSLFIVQDTQTIEGALQEANKNAERLVFLRIMAPNGNVIEDVPLQETDLDNLPKLFNSLPDGRYQIYLKEAGEERIRLLMDVDIRGGKATDVTEDQSNQPSATEKQNPVEEGQTTQLEAMNSPVISSASNSSKTIEGVASVINTNLESTQLQNALEPLGIFTTNALQETYTPADTPEPAPHSNNTHAFSVEKAWSSSALLSGYFHGRSILKKPTKQEEYETAMEKYGQRLMSRHYNIFRRN